MPTTIYTISDGNFDDVTGENLTLNTHPDSIHNDTKYNSMYQIDGTSVEANHGASIFSVIYGHRGHLAFDLSGQSGTVVSADLKLSSMPNLTGFGVFVSTGSTHVCKVNPSSTTYVIGDMDSFDGWIVSASYVDQVTEYATAFTNVQTSSHTVTLNATAITNINSAIGSGNFHIGLINSEDFTLNTGSGGIGNGHAVGGFVRFDGGKFYSGENATDSLKPQIELTYGVLTAVAVPTTKILSGNLTVSSGNVIIK